MVRKPHGKVGKACSREEVKQMYLEEGGPSKVRTEVLQEVPESKRANTEESVGEQEQ